MEQDFARALTFVIEAEGRYCVVPGDHGRAKNRAIEQSEYSAWLAAQGLANADVRAITSTQVATIYRTNYWDAVHGVVVVGRFRLSLSTRQPTAVRAWCGMAE